MSGAGVLDAWSCPERPRRLSMFERLPVVFRHPERFRPVVVHDDPLGRVVGSVSADRMLESGTEGDEIAQVQAALARARHDPGPDDGDFGPRTESAVRAFQRQRGLVVDGVVGPQTLGELTAPLLRRFLDGLDDVLDPVLQLLDNLPAYVSVDTAPDDVLRWLAWVVGADAMEEWGHGRRRAVVGRALQLHGARGTLGGVRAAVALHLDVAEEDVVVSDGGDTSWDLDPDVEVRSTPDRTVHVSLPASAAGVRVLSSERIQRLQDACLPVGFSLDLQVRPSSAGVAG